MPRHKEGLTTPVKTPRAKASTPLSRSARAHFSPSPIGRAKSTTNAPRKASRSRIFGDSRAQARPGFVKALGAITPRTKNRNSALARMAYRQIVDGLEVTRERLLLVALELGVFVSLDRANTYVRSGRLTESAQHLLSEYSRKTGAELVRGTDSSVQNLSDLFDEAKEEETNSNNRKMLKILNERIEGACGKNQCGSYSEMNRR